MDLGISFDSVGPNLYWNTLAAKLAGIPDVAVVKGNYLASVQGLIYKLNPVTGLWEFFAPWATNGRPFPYGLLVEPDHPPP